MILYQILRFMSTVLCAALFRLKAVGRENIPKKGAAIIAANHSSYLDPLAVSVVIPRMITWIIMKPVYRVPWLKWMFVSMKMICENGAIEKCLSVLKNGRALGIFPEGGRSRDGSLLAGRSGVAILALKSGAPVIPCAIRGAFEAYPPQAQLPKPHPIEVRIGKPIIFDAVSDPDEARIASAVDVIMSAIKSLMEEKR